MRAASRIRANACSRLALARGLPVVSTATGAIPELVGEEAGLLVPAGDTTALTSALSRVLGDRLAADYTQGEWLSDAPKVRPAQEESAKPLVRSLLVTISELC